MRQDKTPGMTFESVSMCQQTKIEGGALRRRFKEKKKEGSKEGKKEREQLGGGKNTSHKWKTSEEISLLKNRGETINIEGTHTSLHYNLFLLSLSLI